ncbi:MAG TPA: adenylate/guanylate cyclase domain-containing protein [Xanthobacteraceae bacterium]|nr:adenylate/guanylate cyclase domain-containing protein [Xanthobacteraceae bacterium]
MTETRKLAAILAADIVGYSRLAGADEERTLARLRALRSDLIDPTIAVHHGRVVKRTGDGSIIEFRSVVDAVRCAIEVQNGMIERNSGLPPERRIEFRVGIHLGDVVEESDGDLMGDGVNIAARLEGIAAPGAICLSEDAYRQVRARLDLAVSDLGLTQLKNITEPVRVYSLQVGVPTQAKPGAQAKPASASTPPHLSIVVLPFANLSGDPQQEYFVDGVTESLTSDLSRISGSFVIGRNTAFTYKGKHVDLKQIGHELNVRYVLEGSVQRGGSRMRVNVQLIDAESGNHLWADRFDKPLADLFDMQDEIVARLASQLGTQFIAAEARRAELAPRPDSMDLYFQGMACASKGWTPAYVAQARGFFERALALDPGNIEALVGMAIADTMRGTGLMAQDRAARLAAAEAALTSALSLAPEHALAHLYMGVIKLHTNRAAEGIAEYEQALALDRNLAPAHGYMGQAMYFIGRGEETETHIQEAFRLSPRDTNAYLWIAITGLAKIYLTRDEEAVARFRRSIETNRNFPLAHFCLAAALAHLGRLAEAQSAAQAGLALDATFTISRFRNSLATDNPSYLAGREHIYEGMRTAGVPEG